MRVFKLILILFILLFCSFAEAKGVYYYAGKTVEEAPPASSYILLWDGDACTGNGRTDAKGEGATCGDYTGALTTVTIINTDESNYYLNYTGSNQTFIFDLSGGNWDEDEWYGRFVIKVAAETGDNNIFEYQVDGDNEFELYVSSDGTLRAQYDGSAGANLQIGNDDGIETVYSGYYCVAEVKLSASNNVFALRVCSTSDANCFECEGSEPWDVTIDSGGPDIESFTGSDSTGTFGEAVKGDITDGYHMTEIELRRYSDAP